MFNMELYAVENQSKYFHSKQPLIVLLLSSEKTNLFVNKSIIAPKFNSFVLFVATTVYIDYCHIIDQNKHS